MAESVLSLEDDREKIPPHFISLVATYDSKITYEILTKMKDAYKQVSRGDYSVKEDFLMKLQNKITVGDKMLNSRSNKDTLALYLAHVKYNTLNCIFCQASKKPFKSFIGLVRHVTVKHFTQLDELIIPSFRITKIRKFLEPIRMESKGNDYPLLDQQLTQLNDEKNSTLSEVSVTPPQTPPPVEIEHAMNLEIEQEEAVQTLTHLMNVSTETEMEITTSELHNTVACDSTEMENTTVEKPCNDLHVNVDFFDNVDNCISYTIAGDETVVLSETTRLPSFESFQRQNVCEQPVEMQDSSTSLVNHISDSFVDSFIIEAIDGSEQIPLSGLEDSIQYSEEFVTMMDELATESSHIMEPEPILQECQNTQGDNFLNEIKRKSLSDLVASIPDQEKSTPKRKIATGKGSKIKSTQQNLLPKNISDKMKFKSKEIISSSDESEDEIQPKKKVLRKTKEPVIEESTPSSGTSKRKRKQNDEGVKPTKVLKPKGLPRKRGQRTLSEMFKINDALKFEAKKTGSAANKDTLENMQWTVKMQEEIQTLREKTTESDKKFKVSAMASLYDEDQSPNTVKKIKTSLREFINTHGISNKIQKELSTGKSKFNNMKMNPDATKPLIEFAKNNVTFECYSKNSNNFKNDYVQWFDAFFKFHATTIDNATRKQNKEEAMKATHPSQIWKTNLQKISTFVPFRSEKAIDHLTFLDLEITEPVIKKITADLTLFLDPSNKRTQAEIKSLTSKLLKGKITTTFKDPIEAYTKEDEMKYRKWMNYLKTYKKNINLTPKFKSFMSRLLSVMQDPKNPMNQFTRLSRTTLKKQFDDIIHIYLRTEAINEYNKSGNKNVNKNFNKVILTDHFYDNLMVMLVKFAYARYQQIWFMSKVTKRTAGAGLVEAGIVDCISRQTDLGDLSPFLHNQFETFYSSERISKTLCQLHIMSLNSCNLLTMDDVRKAIENRNPDILELVNTKCGEIIYPIIRSNMFNLLCNVANNIVETYANTPNKPDLSWELYKDVLFQSKWYEYPGLASTCLSFPPILDSINTVDYWKNLSDKNKADILTNSYLKPSITDDDDSDNLNGVESTVNDNAFSNSEAEVDEELEEDELDVDNED